MHAALIRYDGSSLIVRLVLASGAAILFNAIYCLVYRYSAGNPASLGEAFSWGAINLAPWVAAIELGRHLTRPTQSALVIGAALAGSLSLGFVYSGQLPDQFELVRRVPALMLTIAALSGLSLYRRLKAIPQAADEASFELKAVHRCDWARAAGNYVELYKIGEQPVLVRSTMAALVNGCGQDLTRIHRSFAVSPECIAKVEHAHVRLKDGTRLPIGDAYRCAVRAA